jgi:hypothetical protein
MKTILIIFMTFHFDATTVATKTIEFSTAAKCEAAKVAIAKEVLSPSKDPGMGRRGLVAVCVES